MKSVILKLGAAGRGFMIQAVGLQDRKASGAWGNSLHHGMGTLHSCSKLLCDFDIIRKQAFYTMGHISHLNSRREGSASVTYAF